MKELKDNRVGIGEILILVRKAQENLCIIYTRRWYLRLKIRIKVLHYKKNKETCQCDKAKKCMIYFISCLNIIHAYYYKLSSKRYFF